MNVDVSPNAAVFSLFKYLVHLIYSNHWKLCGQGNCGRVKLVLFSIAIGLYEVGYMISINTSTFLFIL